MPAATEGAAANPNSPPLGASAPASAPEAPSPRQLAMTHSQTNLERDGGGVSADMQAPDPWVEGEGPPGSGRRQRARPEGRRVPVGDRRAERGPVRASSRSPEAPSSLPSTANPRSPDRARPQRPPLDAG